MRSMKLALLLTVGALLGSRAIAQAAQVVSDEDRVKFDELYRAKLTAAQTSRITTDDRELAQEMFDLAAQIPDSPGVQCLIYIEAIPLSAVGGDLDLAIQSAGRLELLWPGHEAADRGVLLEYAARAYRDADRELRPAIAEPYLGLLLSSADHAEEADDLEQATALCRQANTIARTVSSPQRERIEARLTQLSEASAVLTRIELLAGAVRKNPQNKPGAKELVELLVVNRGDPAAAAEFAPLTGDEDLAEVVAMCNGGVEEASAAAALRVADWYLALADQEDDYLAEHLLRQAHRWYDRFLEVYPREDALAKRVASMRLVVDGRIKRIAQTQRDAMRGRWIDLVQADFDPRLHTIGESTLTHRRSEIQLTAGSFVLPVTPEGDFELRLQFTMNQATPGLTVHLPVGRTAATFNYAILNNTTNSIEGLNEVDFAETNMNRPGRRFELTYQAKLMENNEIALALLVNGQVSLNWQGSADEVRPLETNLPPEHHGRALMFTCNGDITFHRIELRERAE